MASTLLRPPILSAGHGRSCARLQCHSRLFSSTPTSRNVGPESPKFIEIPKPPQQEYIPRPYMKGTLPTPRKVFHRRTMDKTSEAFLSAATAEPKSDTLSTSRDPLKADWVAWKARMAVFRRQNLRESIAVLYKRKERTESMKAERSQRLQAEREQLVNAPQREEDRLTSPSISPALQQRRQDPLPDPDREARMARARQYLEAKREAFTEMKTEKLHGLYMQARDFITTESQLNEAIDRIFVAQPQEFAGDMMDGESIWNTGHQETVRTMVTKILKTDRRDTTEGYSKVNDDRVKRIAEELTGGKL